METLTQILAPWYMQIKFLHVISVAMWSFSTAVAYRDYIVPAFKSVEHNPNDETRIARRNDFMERFDSGVVLEHVAFPLIVITGLIMLIAGGWSFEGFTWLTLKLWIVVLVFVPMEVVDYYISHFGGQKLRIRRTGDMARYERYMQIHWLFFKISTPFIIIFIPLTYYLAIVKPF
ncbi:MAG: hypothetical protein Q7T44_13130 [Parvibaculum sp.]|nr:hypothetical protein [Parvibaculum sp.]